MFILVENVIRGAPSLPRFVVIITRPLDALEPYCAAAAAPLITLMLSISEGFISTSLFVPSEVAPPTWFVNAVWETFTVELLTNTPSITYRGSEFPCSDFTPRRRMVIPPAGSPEFCVICAPGTLPCNALNKLLDPEFSNDLVLTDEMLFPNSRLLLLNVEPTTKISSSCVMSSSRTTSSVMVSWLSKETC